MKFNMNNIYFICCCFIFVVGIGYALECYTCLHQDNNRDKCIKTVKQCEQNQDVCRTNVSWGIPPYWTPHGDRIYKISKDCDTGLRCENARSSLKLRCKRDWYDDWDCVECCYGDMCNYYATLSAPSIYMNKVLCMTSLCLWYLFRTLLQ